LPSTSYEEIVIHPPRNQLLRVHLSLLLTAAIWGGTIPAIKYLLRTLEPNDVLLLRVGGAALIFTAILATQGRRAFPHSRRDTLSLLALGILGITVMNLALINGQTLIPAALASLIVTSNPVFTAIFSRILKGEPMTARKIGGIALAGAGFVIVLLWGSGKDAELSAEHIKGMLIVMIAPFSWSIYTVLTKPYLTEYPPTNVAGYTAIAGFLGALPLLGREGGAVHRLRELDSLGVSLIVFLSAFGFVVAYVLWYRGLQVLSASQTAVYIYLVPVFGLFFAWRFLGEEITPYLLLGGATILAGVVLTNTARPAPVRVTPLPAMESAAIAEP
jgi:drug/metabolite transporter (DMT)-like permease